MQGMDWYRSSIAAYLETALHASYTVRWILTPDTSLRQIGNIYTLFTPSHVALFMLIASSLRYMLHRYSHFHVDTGFDTIPSPLCTRKPAFAGAKTAVPRPT